jgi:hypothetical protein
MLSSMCIIEEEVRYRMLAGVTYVARILDRIDPSHRLSHAAIAASIIGADYRGWQTQSQQAASPHSHRMRTGDAPASPVHLQPGHRSRSALTMQRDELVEDLITLLRRKFTI